VPEVFHGAGGTGYHDGRFVVIGGLPPGVEENYVYESKITIIISSIS
jgi:hypothetical protein